MAYGWLRDVAPSPRNHRGSDPSCPVESGSACAVGGCAGRAPVGGAEHAAAAAHRPAADDDGGPPADLGRDRAHGVPGRGVHGDAGPRRRPRGRAGGFCGRRDEARPLPPTGPARPTCSPCCTTSASLTSPSTAGTAVVSEAVVDGLCENDFAVHRSRGRTRWDTAGTFAWTAADRPHDDVRWRELLLCGNAPADALPVTPVAAWCGGPLLRSPAERTMFRRPSPGSRSAPPELVRRLHRAPVPARITALIEEHQVDVNTSEGRVALIEALRRADRAWD